LETTLPFDELPSHVQRGDGSEIMNSDGDHMLGFLIFDCGSRIADRESAATLDPQSSGLRQAFYPTQC
jgi:hypothetical protein